MARYVFTGGGSGGHIFPGIAVAQHLPKDSVVWIGSSQGGDKTIVENANITFYGVPSGKLRRYLSFQNFIDGFKVIAGFFASLRLLRKLKPQLVFSKGGFVSVPPCLAAKFLKIPVVTHECDFSPGLATKINARSATKILTSYEATIDLLPKNFSGEVQCTGNPVRKEFYNGDKTLGRQFLGVDDSKPILAVLGGSLGAKKVNDLIMEAIEFLCERFVVVHQVGGQHIEQCRLIEDKLKSKPELAKNYKSFAFINKEMPDVLSAADLVLSRAGANTIWESSAAGKPMILIPLETSQSRGDQLENAEYFREKGAALVLSENSEDKIKPTAENLKRLIGELIDSPETLKEIARCSAALTQGNPAREIARIIESFGQGEKN